MRGPGFSRLAVALLVLLGFFLSTRGYCSREGDQAYRLPLLLHERDRRVLANDTFVRYFDVFNPHKGSLALIDLATRPFGLSVGLFALFVLTFLATGVGLERLGRAVWPEYAGSAGIVAMSLVFVAQAGNIGTNHLFEPLLLDRLMAFALGWLAIGCAVAQPEGSGRWSPAFVGLAALIHPSLGIQLAMLLGAAWLIWAGLGEQSWVGSLRSLGLLSIAILPGYWLNIGGTSALLDGASADEYRLFCVELQSPQHMLPHLWRTPQWLAWGCYPLLGLLAVETWPPPARRRLLVLLVVALSGLGLAWFGVEVLRSLPFTLFQPFRVATIVRGLCLVLVSGHMVRLWRLGTMLGRLRSALLIAGLLGDWTLVVVSAFELPMVFRDRLGTAAAKRLRGYEGVLLATAFATLAGGLAFLMRHDTECGHLVLLPAGLSAVLFGGWIARREWMWTPRRTLFRLGLAWAVPLLALAANLLPESSLAIQAALVKKCRFAEVPTDDLERLALWCRAHTPEDARFIGPPGPKTFRLWALRGLAFNRAGSPYHASGVADWAARFRDHVAFEGTDASFVRAYQTNRQVLERRYDGLGDRALAALAGRQGASYVLARATGSYAGSSALQALHTEGRYTIFRVLPEAQVARAMPR